MKDASRKVSITKTCNDTEYALSFLKHYKDRKIPASLFTYNSALNAMALSGLLDAGYESSKFGVCAGWYFSSNAMRLHIKK